MAKKLKDPNDSELKTIEGVEIFAVGTWNGDEFSDSDLTQIESTFNKTKDKLKPFLKIGHSNKQNLLAEDELPQAGLIDNVRKVGKKLFADFVDVPRKIFEVVKKKAFNKVSAELFVNMSIDGERHPFALKAVALLGGATPAVHDLNSILDLFVTEGVSMAFDDSKNKTKDYAMSIIKEDANMDRIEELMRENAKLSGEVKSFQDENAELEKEAKEKEEAAKKAEAENAGLKEDNAKLGEEKKLSEKAAFETKAKAFVEKLDILPVQRPILFSLLTQATIASEVKEFSVEGKENKFSSIEELMTEFFKAGDVDLNFEENTELGEKNAKSEEAFVKKAKDYAEKNKVSLKEAYVAVSE